MNKLSIVIPAYNERDNIVETVKAFYNKLIEHNIENEIVVVNDNSKDDTLLVLEKLKEEVSTLVYYSNTGPNGFGYAVRYGLEKFTGDYVAIVMADLSDSPDDLVSFYNKILEGYDCVFGTRWSRGGKVYDYPKLKYFLNRLFNYIIKVFFRLKYDDVTNAFKMYKAETIDGVKPLLSPHFNLTVEIPLKAIVRGYTYAVLPNTWRNRKFGESNLKIREMGSRYSSIH